MKIALLADPKSFFIPQYIKEVLFHFEEEVEISILCPFPKIATQFDSFYEENKILVIDTQANSVAGKFLQKKKFFRTAINFFNLLKRSKKLGKVDIVILQSVNSFSTFFASRAFKKSRTFYIYWGSDLFRQSTRSLKKGKRLLNRKAEIIFLTENLYSHFSKVLGEPKQKYHILDFGIVALSAMKRLSCNKENSKKALDFPLEKISIAIGYNGIEQQQQDKVLSELMNLPSSLKGKIHIVLHFIPPQETTPYYQKVSQMLEQSDFSFSIIKGFLSTEQIATLRSAMDIFINAQTTDALSASMVEYLYAKALVLNGSWLDYPEFDKKNIFYIKYNQLTDLNEVLIDTIERYPFYAEQAKKNQTLIYSLYAWESLSPKWITLLGGTPKC